MFDMSWGEIMVIGGVALVVIGPKDLPKALRTVGQMTTKVRRLAGEFQAQFQEAMREAELDDVRKEVEGLNRDVASATSTAFNPIQTIRDELKGAVEGRPAPAPTGATAEWTPGQSDLTAGMLEENGPTHHVEPAAEVAPPHTQASEHPAGPAAFGEATPLVPLPVDEPVLPPSDPSRLVTGPGLEPVAETEMPALQTPGEARG